MIYSLTLLIASTIFISSDAAGFNDILGCYANIPVEKVAEGSDAIRVSIPNRAVATGNYNGDSKSGSVNFPDDRVYNFNYEPANNKIDWGSNNIWNRGGVDIAGTYLNGGPIITRGIDDTISVDMSSYNRPTASGTVTCPSTAGQPYTGSVTFPDDTTYSLYYYPEEGKIYWGGDKYSTNNIWTRTSGSNANSFSNMNLEWNEPKEGGKTGFEIVTNKDGYFTFELLCGIIFVLVVMNIICGYMNFVNNKSKSKGYKAVSYDTETDAV